MERRRRILNRKGLTLVEVMAALAILMLSAEIIALGVGFNARMNTRAKAVSRADEKIGQEIQDDSAGEKANLSLKIQGAEIQGTGRFYTETPDGGAGPFAARGVWAGDEAVEDLFGGSGLEAVEDLRDKPEAGALPAFFPDIEEASAEVTDVSDGYLSYDETGKLVFGTEDGGGMSWADTALLSEETGADGINIGESGSYTAPRTAVLKTAAINMTAPRVSLWLKSEIYCFSGYIWAGGTVEKAADGTAHLYLVPESGHGQPALVFIDGELEISREFTLESGEVVGGEEAVLVLVEPGWYEIPAGKENAGGTADSRTATDLFALTEEDWKRFRLTDDNTELSSGAVDRAYARLVMAGVIEQAEEEEP